MQRPQLSLLCASYNHERFVHDFLTSVLAQSIPQWELIVVDDCSTDANVAVIQEINDPRIILCRHTRNEGTTKSLQDAFSHASAPIVAWVASDDVLEPNYIKVVLDAFAEHPDVAVVYTPLFFIDENGKLVGRRTHLPTGKTREEIFASMFAGENLLHSPGMAMRRDAFEAMLPLDIGMLQLADWQLHLRLLYHYQPFMLDKPIMRYRISGGSACSRSCAAEFRENAERDSLMDTVRTLIGGDVEAFRRLFSTISEFDPKDVRDIPFLLGMIALHSPIASARLWGGRTIIHALSTATSAQRIYDNYGIGYSQYMRLTTIASLIDKDGESFDVQRYKGKVRRYKVLSLLLFLVAVAFAVAMLIVL